MGIGVGVGVGVAFRFVLAAGGHRHGGGVSWTLSMGGTIRIRDKSISILLVGYDIKIPRRGKAYFHP
jgi:hypothetical protein